MASPAFAAAAQQIGRWRADPRVFARECLGVVPDRWQDKVMGMVDPGGQTRIAMKACVGPGKSAVLAWMGWWFMLTQVDKGNHPKVIALSCSEKNLQDGLWSELAKWRANAVSPVLREVFDHKGDRITAKGFEKTWFMSARSFAQSAKGEAQATSLSGLHSDYMCYLLDETGDMSPHVGQRAEQGAGTAKVGMIIQAGNPTSTKGLLYESVKASGIWKSVSITSDPLDPDRTPRVPIAFAQAQIDRYGRDNPFVQFQILGQFPTSGLDTLLGSGHIDIAQARNYIDGTGAVILGVDVARQGDDRTVIVRRDGLRVLDIEAHRIPDAMQVADRVGLHIARHEPHAVFVDGTGGYGAGVIDRLRQLGHQVIEVQFAGAATDRDRFANKRAEMWWGMAEWIKRTGQIPRDAALAQELTEVTYGFNGAGRLFLEAKDDIKKRLGSSPDLADALACTFAAPVKDPSALSMVERLRRALGPVPATRAPYDPFARVRT